MKVDEALFVTLACKNCNFVSLEAIIPAFSINFCRAINFIFLWRFIPSYACDKYGLLQVASRYTAAPCLSPQELGREKGIFRFHAGAGLEGNTGVQ
jgi:hypothetical protein